MSDEEINQLIRAARNTTGSPFVNRLGEVLMKQRERAEAAANECDRLREKLAKCCGDLMIADQRVRAAEKRTADLVAAYDHNNPLRTADIHRLDCTCMRCAIDKVRVALEAKP